MTRKRRTAKDIKNQRWATIVAAILALGMFASIAGIYLGQTPREDGPPPGMGSGEQSSEPGFEEYLAYYEGEAARLEEYLAENPPTEAVLMQLADNYRALAFFQGSPAYSNGEKLAETNQRLIEIQQELVLLDEDNPAYRLELIRAYLEVGGDDYAHIADREIAALQEELHSQPDPLLGLALLEILKSAGRDDLYNEELIFVGEHLEQLATGPAPASEDLLYFAILQGEHRGDRDAALELASEVMEKEGEGSWLYQEAASYLAYLGAGAEEDTEDEGQ